MVKEYIERNIKISIIINSVIACDPLPALKDKLIAECGIWWGTSRRTALEYFNELVADEQIFIDDNNVWTFNRWLKIEKARKLDHKHMSNILNKSFQKQL